MEYELSIELQGARVRLKFDVGDSESAWSTLRHPAGSFHERGIAPHFATAVSKASAFVDVGGYIGWYSCLANRLNPALHLVLFEPDPENLARARRNLSLNPGLRDPILIEAAVGEREGATWLVRAAGGRAMQNRVAASPSEDVESIRVPETTVDIWCTRNRLVPDVIKIDVEGAEAAVLRGMHQVVARGRPVLFLELHPELMMERGDSVPALLESLRMLGYQLRACDKDEGSLQDFKSWDRLPTSNPMLICYPT